MSTPATDTELREVLNAVNALSQRVEVGFADLRGEMNVKFAEVDTKLAKLEGKIDVIDERTKLGFWGFVQRAVIVSLLGFLIFFVERLWRTVKYENVYLHCYTSVQQAQEELEKYFDFYNNVRLHQSLGYQTPAAVHYQEQRG